MQILRVSLNFTESSNLRHKNFLCNLQRPLVCFCLGGVESLLIKGSMFTILLLHFASIRVWRQQVQKDLAQEHQDTPLLSCEL